MNLLRFNVIVIFLILIFLLMILEIIFIIKSKKKLRDIFKSLPLLFISILFLVINFKNYYLIALIALFYAIGDFLLIFKGKKFFTLGATFFFFGHLLLTFNIFYKNKVDIYSIIFAVIFSLFFFSFIYFNGKRWLKKLTLTAALYFAFLLLNANIVLFNRVDMVLFLGIATFIGSDLLVVKERFFIKGKNTHLAVMLTYYLANLLIFASFLIN